MSLFRDKVAVVTGAGSGIGRALSQELFRHGARLVVCDVRRDRIDSLEKEIQQSGGSVTALTVDVCDWESVNRMVTEAFTHHSRLDYLFNIAGIAVAGEVRDVSIEDWHSVLNVNLFGVINGVAAAYPLMVKQGFGHIINMASIEGLVPFPGTAAYVASKYGVVGLSHVLRLEGVHLGVKVTVVCPGHVKTPIFEESKIVGIDRDKFMKSLTAIPGVTPEECARRILRGVEKNRATIVVTGFAKTLWILQRMSPGLTMRIMKAFMKPLRDARIKEAQGT